MLELMADLVEEHNKDLFMKLIMVNAQTTMVNSWHWLFDFGSSHRKEEVRHETIICYDQ
jgi:hypothetical protein